MLESCPRCGYSLHGLPADHICPECGLCYDAGSAVYRAVNRKLISAFFAGGLGWTYGLISLVRASLVVPPPGRVFMVLLLIVYVVGLAWGARQIYQLMRRGPIVAVLPDGLFIRLQRLDGEFIAWSNIARAAANKNMKSVALFIRDAKMVRDLAGVFRTPFEVEQFTAQVNARVSAAGSGDDRRSERSGESDSSA